MADADPDTPPNSVAEFSEWSSAGTCGDFDASAALWYRSNQGNVIQTLTDSDLLAELPGALQTAEDWAGQRDELPIRLEILSNFYRDARVAATGVEDDMLVHRDLAATAREVGLSPESLDECFQLVGNARSELARAAQDPRLILEHMFLELAALR